MRDIQQTIRNNLPILAIGSFVLIALLVFSIGSGERSAGNLEMTQQNKVFAYIRGTQPFYLGDTVTIRASVYCGAAGTDWNREHWGQDCGAINPVITLKDNRGNSRDLPFSNMYNCKWGSSCKQSIDIQLNSRWVPGSWTLVGRYNWDGDNSIESNDPRQYLVERSYVVKKKVTNEIWDCPSKWSDCSSDGEQARVCTSNLGGRRVETQACTPTCYGGKVWLNNRCCYDRNGNQICDEDEAPACTGGRVYLEGRCCFDTNSNNKCDDTECGGGLTLLGGRCCVDSNYNNVCDDEEETCTVGWKCKDGTTKGYQLGNCDWVNEEQCSSDERCEGGYCVPQVQPCPSGQVRIEGRCCVDANGNGICDEDETECQADNDCIWCGANCVKRISGMVCPTMVPPAGYICMCVDGSCSAQPQSCPAGQVRIEGKCCVDSDNNGICDDDEPVEGWGWRVTAEETCILDQGDAYQPQQYKYYASKEECEENISAPWGTYAIIGIIVVVLLFIAAKFVRGSGRGHY